MSSFNPTLGQSGEITALGIDVRASLAFGRAALMGVCSVSPEAKAAVLAVLEDEAAAVRMDEMRGSEAIEAMLIETRRWLEAS